MLPLPQPPRCHRRWRYAERSPGPRVFYLVATDAKPAYSIGASEWGALPQWFGWVKPKDSTAPSRSFLTRPAFKRRRTADAWTSNALAAEVIAAIRDDLAAHRRA